MPVVTKSQCRALIYHAFLFAGLLPEGTTTRTWSTVQIGAVGFDDPPLAGDPHFQKEKMARELQAAFVRMSAVLQSPLAQLKVGESTLGELAAWCFDNQERE